MATPVSVEAFGITLESRPVSVDGRPHARPVELGAWKAGTGDAMQMQFNKHIRMPIRRAAKAAYWSLPAAVDRLVDLRYCVRTTGRIDLRDLGVPQVNRIWYQAYPWPVLRRALAELEPSPADAFLDVGSGMGRALIAAAMHPYERVIGVENSEHLVATARANVRRARAPRRCKVIEVVVSDALDYAVPRDVTVFYLFNPFTGPVFAEFMSRVFASLDRHPRHARLVYAYPFEHNYLIGTGRVHAVNAIANPWSARLGKPGDVVVTYALSESGAPPPAPHPGASPALELWRGTNDLAWPIEDHYEHAR